MSLRFDIPKIVRPLALSGYAPEYGEAAIQVWVNPPRGMLRRYYDLADQGRLTQDAGELEQLSSDILAWLAEVWSQGPEDTRWTADEAREMFEHCQENDPALWQYIARGTWEMIQEHRHVEKKASRLP